MRRVTHWSVGIYFSQLNKSLYTEETFQIFSLNSEAFTSEFRENIKKYFFCICNGNHSLILKVKRKGVSKCMCSLAIRIHFQANASEFRENLGEKVCSKILDMNIVYTFKYLAFSEFLDAARVDEQALCFYYCTYSHCVCQYFFKNAFVHARFSKDSYANASEHEVKIVIYALFSNI